VDSLRSHSTTGDYTSPDEVYVVLRTGGRAVLQTAQHSLNNGEDHIFLQTLRGIPWEQALQIDVFDDDPGADELLFSAPWGPPYATSFGTQHHNGAECSVEVSFDR
jgi:hypothetical protein